MKKYLVLMICGFLLAGPASAWAAEGQTYGDRLTAISERAERLLHEAERQAMEQCSTTRIVVPLPGLETKFTEQDMGAPRISYVERTFKTTVSIEWSGACADGKRDGEGVLSWTEEREREAGTATVEARRSEGRFVKGQRLGLWCETYKIQVINAQGQLSHERSDNYGCSILAGHGKPLTTNYRKQPDGSWRELSGYGFESPTGVSLAAGALEAQSAKVLADAAAGKTDLKAAFVVHNQSLDDLVRGSKIVLSLSAAPISLKDKRIAIVLSSQTVNELERFKRERQALIDASAGLSGKAATERANFIQASSPDRLLITLLKLVKKYVKDAQPADDLTGLRKGGFDYALVVDWKSMTRFDLLGKYDSFPMPPSDIRQKSIETQVKYVVVGESLGGFLISRDLKAVKQIPALPYVTMRGKIIRMSFDNSDRSDEDYMRRLAGDFAGNWGDDNGYSAFTGVGAMLKGEQ